MGVKRDYRDNASDSAHCHHHGSDVGDKSRPKRRVEPHFDLTR